MSRELTREEKRAIRKLVFSLCANYDRELTAGRPLLYAGEMLDGSLLPLLPGCRSAQ